MSKRFLYAFFAFCLLSSLMWAQEKTINGTVLDQDQFPMADVEVKVLSTGKSVLTDLDGNYSIEASEGDQLQFTSSDSRVLTQTVGSKSTLDLTFESDQYGLNELVVVGYGTQKKMDLTGAISTVDASQITRTPAANVLQSIQGKVPGVQISSLGAPGDSPQMIIRGLNSYRGNSSPLFVVDGMFYDNIDFLDPNEIDNFIVLKDASASAIYGVRAANGVVVITTKKGSFDQKPEVTYTTYMGIQVPQNVLQMANSEQFTIFARESNSATEIASIDAAMQRFGRSDKNPNIPNVNTDWYQAVLRSAPMMSHDIGIRGGSEKINYSLGGAYFYQQGILDMKNDYRRYNFRGTLDAKINNWLSAGVNILYSRGHKNSIDGSAWDLAYSSVPILPYYDESFVDADYKPYADGQSIGYRDHQNPLRILDNFRGMGERKTTNATAYLDFQILPKNLNFKTSFNYSNKDEFNKTIYFPYFVNSEWEFERTPANSPLTQSTFNFENYIWDNVMNYTNTFGDHDITVMGGTSFRSEFRNQYQATGKQEEGGLINRYDSSTWYLDYTDPESRNVNVDDFYNKRYIGTSVFGRASYKFKNRYILYGTLRNEGSNKYDEKYVTLPAFGAAWVISEENFLSNVKFMDFLKFRASWGRLANDGIPRSRPQTDAVANTVFNDNLVTGSTFSTFKDVLSWEYTEETNLGISSNWFKNRLSFEFDYFDKNTKELAIPVEPVIGTEVSYLNVGTLNNKGYEWSAEWTDQKSNGFGYSLSFNYTHIKNKITDLHGQAYINTGQAEFRQRLVVGQPINVFYGWEIDGVYQNQAEIDADPTAQAAIATGTEIKPGYYKYKDLNGDGIIDGDDRDYLGSPVPTYYFGGNLGLFYKGLELNVSFYSQGGNKILNRSRAQVIWTPGQNIDAELAKNRWHGEGTSNDLPSSEGFRQSWNQRMSKLWLSDGNFFRIQNIQLAYNLEWNNLPKMRFYASANRPFLWTKSYNGMNPEVGFNGIDSQTYPIPSVYSFGVDFKF